MPRVRRPLLALIALILALLIGYGVNALRSHDDPSPTPSATSQSSQRPSSAGTPLSSLPKQAAQTVALIRSGGPFPYPHNDGLVFHNAEHILPMQKDGYYHEYTVPTPGASTRGTRRIITGANATFYYTGDHYEHFVVVDVGR
ncbi:MAG: ribonuclease domain-containing protein [Jatrophihabitantaceae bacterium]